MNHLWKCPYCASVFEASPALTVLRGAEFVAGFSEKELICPNCKSKLDFQALLAGEYDVATTTATAAADEHKETYAQTECKASSAKQPGRMQVRICPKCGRHNRADAWYCAGEACGATLSLSTLTDVAEPLTPDQAEALLATSAAAPASAEPTSEAPSAIREESTTPSTEVAPRESSGETLKWIGLVLVVAALCGLVLPALTLERGTGRYYALNPLCIMLLFVAGVMLFLVGRSRK